MSLLFGTREAVTFTAQVREIMVKEDNGTFTMTSLTYGGHGQYLGHGVAGETQVFVHICFLCGKKSVGTGLISSD